MEVIQLRFAVKQQSLGKKGTRDNGYPTRSKIINLTLKIINIRCELMYTTEIEDRTNAIFDN
jgi:hypothetical protein